MPVLQNQIDEFLAARNALVQALNALNNLVIGNDVRKPNALWKNASFPQYTFLIPVFSHLDASYKFPADLSAQNNFSNAQEVINNLDKLTDVIKQLQYSDYQNVAAHGLALKAIQDYKNAYLAVAIAHGFVTAKSTYMGFGTPTYTYTNPQTQQQPTPNNNSNANNNNSYTNQNFNNNNNNYNNNPSNDDDKFSDSEERNERYTPIQSSDIDTTSSTQTTYEFRFPQLNRLATASEIERWFQDVLTIRNTNGTTRNLAINFQNQPASNPVLADVITFTVANADVDLFKQRFTQAQQDYANFATNDNLNFFAERLFNSLQKNEVIFVGGLHIPQPDLFKGVTVNFTIDKHSQLDATAWLTQRLTTIVTPATTTAAAATRPLHTNLTVAPGTGAASTQHNVSIHFANQNDAELFIENLSGAAQTRRTEKQDALRVAKLLAHRVGGVAADKVVYKQHGLQPTIELKVTPEMADRAGFLLTSLYSPNNTALPGTAINFTPGTSAADEGTLTITFADPAVLKDLEARINADASAGYPLPALATTLEKEVTELRDSLTASLDNMGASVRAAGNTSNLIQRVYNTNDDSANPPTHTVVDFTSALNANDARNSYAQSRVGAKNYITMRFSAPDAFFTDATGASPAPSPYRRLFAQFEQSKHMSLRVTPSHMGHREITLTVEENEEGLAAARKFESTFFDAKPVEIEKQRGYNSVFDGAIRALRGFSYVLIAPFLPIFIAASSIAEAIYVTAKGEPVPSDAKYKGLGAGLAYRLRQLQQRDENNQYDTNDKLAMTLAQLRAFAFPKSNFIIHMLERWQTFSIFNKDRFSGNLLAADDKTDPLGIRRFYGLMLMLLNLPIDLLVSTISAVLRSVFDFDKDGKYELMAKRGLTYAWTALWLFALAATIVGFTAAALVGFAHLGGAKGVGFYMIFDPVSKAPGFVMANLILPVLEYPFATLIEGAGKFIYATTGFDWTMISVAMGVVLVAIVAAAALAIKPFIKTESTAGVSKAPLITPTDTDKTPSLAQLSNGHAEMLGIDATTRETVVREVKAAIPDPKSTSTFSGGNPVEKMKMTSYNIPGGSGNGNRIDYGNNNNNSNNNSNSNNNNSNNNNNNSNNNNRSNNNFCTPNN